MGKRLGVNGAITVKSWEVLSGYESDHSLNCSQFGTFETGFDRATSVGRGPELSLGEKLVLLTDKP